MDMSWQTTFALVCAALFAAVVPGTLGYATARLETAEQQRQEVVRLRAEVQAARKADQQVSRSCEAETPQGDQDTSDDQGDPGDAAIFPDAGTRSPPAQARPGHRSRPAGD